MRSAIWIATLIKCNKIADLLTRCGFDVTESIGSSNKYDNDATLLHIAAGYGKTRRCKLLLGHGAKINATDSWSRTPLHYAVSRLDHVKVVELLIKNGASIDAKNRDGLTPLHVAVLTRSKNTARLLLENGADLEAVDLQGRSALHHAVVTGDIQIMHMLLRYGITLDKGDEDMATPLFYAMTRNNHSIAQFLIEHGANINAQMGDGCFPLYCAVTLMNMSVVKLLLSNGANANLQTIEGETSLHISCKKGFQETTRILIDSGANVNLKNIAGKTALAHAAAEMNHDAGKVLIKHIAKLVCKGKLIDEENWKTIRENLIFQEFYDSCHNELVRMMQEKVQEHNNVSYYYILSKDVEQVAQLTRNAELVDAFESNGCLEKFTVYADDLTTKFSAGKRRMHFLCSMESYLCPLLNSRLPVSTIQHIVSYLKSENFKVPIQ